MLEPRATNRSDHEVVHDNEGMTEPCTTATALWEEITVALFWPRTRHTKFTVQDLTPGQRTRFQKRADSVSSVGAEKRKNDISKKSRAK